MLKPLRTDATAVLVWPEDPAVDVDHKMEDGALAVARYEEKVASDPGSWRSLLRMRDGMQPTEFVIGPIPPSTLARIEDDARLGKGDLFRSRTLAWESFCASLVDVRNSGCGEATKSKGRVSREWIEQHCTGQLRAAAMWVGMAAWQWNQLSEADAKN